MKINSILCSFYLFIPQFWDIRDHRVQLLVGSEMPSTVHQLLELPASATYCSDGGKVRAADFESCHKTALVRVKGELFSLYR